ncbi:MAG: PadR family transcriptional regulator [Candidatus Nanopelagicales bacterium]
MFGPMGPAGPWGPGGRRRGRRDRGDVRAAILLLLAEQPRHGYEIITEIADRSDGAWQPSPGSVYPTLKRLAREGLVGPDTDDHGKRVFSLTDKGRQLVDAEGAGWGEPWVTSGDSDGDDTERRALWQEAQQLAAAVWQVSQLNKPEDLQAATEALADARKAIYRRLAE